MKVVDIDERTVLEQEITSMIGKISPEIKNIAQYKDYYEEKLNACYPDKLPRRKRGNWYNHDGSIGGIRDLFKYVGMEQNYVVFYRTLSDATHGIDALTYLVVDEHSFGTSEHLERDAIEGLLNSFIFEITSLAIDYYGLKKKAEKYMRVIRINFKNNYSE